MKDPKEVMRTYTKAEFPELAKALDGMPTVTEKEYQQLKRNSQEYHRAMKDGFDEMLHPTDIIRTPDLISFDEVQAAVNEAKISKSRVMDDFLMVATQEALSKCEILRLVYIGPEETPLPPPIQLLLDKGLIEVDRRSATADEGRTFDANIIICDELVDGFNRLADFDKLNCRAMGRNYGRVIYDDVEVIKTKKSQSTNPSDRWIKPKKLRRAKGGRK